MKAVLFDLDNTLYPAECDLFSLIDVRINRFMEDVAAIAPEEVDCLRDATGSITVQHYRG